MRGHSDEFMDGHLMRDDPAAEVLAAARRPGSPAEVAELAAALEAYRATAPPSEAVTGVLPEITARPRGSARLARRLGAASLATKLALVTGVAVAATTGSIAVTAVVEHQSRNPAPPAISVATPRSEGRTGPPPSSAGSAAANRPGAPPGKSGLHRHGVGKDHRGKHGLPGLHGKQHPKPKWPKYSRRHQHGHRPHGAHGHPRR